MQLGYLQQLLKQQEIRMAATDEALEYISNVGFDPQFGARPVKRIIQKEVLNELSKQILKGTVMPSSQVVLDVFDGKMVFRNPVKESEKV